MRPARRPRDCAPAPPAPRRTGRRSCRGPRPCRLLARRDPGGAPPRHETTVTPVRTTIMIVVRRRNASRAARGGFRRATVGRRRTDIEVDPGGEHADRHVPAGHRGHLAGGGREHPHHRRALLRAPVRAAPGAARRHLQPREPGRGHPAAGPRRVGGPVRQRAGQPSRPAARAPAVPGGAQARLAGHRPDQYQVVYDNLMWAIADVLGDAVTPDVAAAWTEVYWLMADALINQERGLYSARGVRPETMWRDWRGREKKSQDQQHRPLLGRRPPPPPGGKPPSPAGTTPPRAGAGRRPPPP